MTRLVFSVCLLLFAASHWAQARTHGEQLLYPPAESLQSPHVLAVLPALAVLDDAGQSGQNEESDSPYKVYNSESLRRRQQEYKSEAEQERDRCAAQKAEYERVSQCYAACRQRNANVSGCAYCGESVKKPRC